MEFGAFAAHYLSCCFLSASLVTAIKWRQTPGMVLWLEFAGAILGVMGSLLLPMLIVFDAYSVNNIEHKAETWKTLFSLPLSKWSVYSAKYFYALTLIVICLVLFVLFSLGLGNLLSLINPALKFNEYHAEGTLSQIYFKLLLSSLGILSIQFLLSLLFRDFLKPMGIGFVATVSGIIMANVGWKYAYMFPYAHPMLTVRSLNPGNTGGEGMAMPQLTVDLFHQRYLGESGSCRRCFYTGLFYCAQKEREIILFRRDAMHWRSGWKRSLPHRFRHHR